MHWWTNNSDKKEGTGLEKYLSSQSIREYQEYKMQRKIVKHLIEREIINACDKLGTIMDKNYKENQKLLYKVIKKIQNGKECNKLKARREL